MSNVILEPFPYSPQQTVHKFANEKKHDEIMKYAMR